MVPSIDRGKIMPAVNTKTENGKCILYVYCCEHIMLYIKHIFKGSYARLMTNIINSRYFLVL